MGKSFSTNRTWASLIALTLFVSLVWLNNFAVAQDNYSQTTQSKMDFKTAKKLIINVRANKLDYLKNEKQLKNAFETSKSQNWEALHFEAAALYAELLFRQERYDEQNTHVSGYLENEVLRDQWDLHLLLLESKLKYLSRQEDRKPAKTLAKKLEDWLPKRTAKEQIIISRALAYYYTAIDALRKTLKIALDGLELAMDAGDSASQGFFLRKIADAYNYLDEKDKAVIYAQKAVTAYEKTHDEHFTAKAHWSLGNALIDVKNPKDAVGYFKKSLVYFKSVNMQKGIVFAQYSIANIQYAQGNDEDAIDIANENIVRANVAGVFDMQLASMILLSEIYLKQEQLEKANDISDQVFVLLDKFSRSVYKSNFLNKRYILKKRLGYNNDAFEAIEQELIHTKKHLEATSESNIKILQVKFGVKEKEDEILRLAHEKDISELKAKEERQYKIIWRLSAAIASFLVFSSLVLFYRQVLQRKKYHSISLTDYLTKAPNRRGIMRIAADGVRGGNITIAIADLDYFKKINDSFGHDFGDLVLIAFARASKKTLRENDKFGRYGGEEWLFVLHTTDQESIDKIFTRLSENFSRCCADIIEEKQAFEGAITFSMGATISSSTNNNLDALIKRADKLLYKAKDNGRNQVIIE